MRYTFSFVFQPASLHCHNHARKREIRQCTNPSYPLAAPPGEELPRFFFYSGMKGVHDLVLIYKFKERLLF